MILHSTSAEWPQQRLNIPHRAEEKPELEQEQCVHFGFNAYNNSSIGTIRKPTPPVPFGVQ